MYYRLFILIMTFVWIIIRFYKLSDMEFIILFVILLFILYNSINRTEFFYDDFSFNKLYEIPKYIERSIGDGLDKIIKASQPQDSSSNNNVNDMAFLTPELFLSDDKLLSNNKVDDTKYNLLVNEYLNLESIFNLINSKYTNQYNAIFS